MNSDDRQWRAEDLLEFVTRTKQDFSASTESRIQRFFDGIESPSKSGIEQGLQAGRDADPVGDASALATGPKAAAAEVPTSSGLAIAIGAFLKSEESAPVQVPNHELMRCLGKGGFGQVWLARQTLTEHYRACKLIFADNALELEGLRHLKRVPAHENLFPIEEVGEVQGWLYCLMPLADPAPSDQAALDTSTYAPFTLHTHLQRNGRRPTREVATIGLSVARAVRHLHTHGVSHGDIKPANIMRYGGRWALADYGLARDLAVPRGDGHTRGYVPEEGPGSTAADQYAIGIVLMELLTNLPTTMHKEFVARPIEDFRLDGLGGHMAAIIRRATAKDPKDRFGSIDELVVALAAVAEPRRLGRQVAVIVLICAGILILGTIGLKLTQSHPGTRSGPTNVASPIAVTSFAVRHYRYNPETHRTIETSPIGADGPVAHADDDVTVHAKFSTPVYFYLVSLDADGVVRPRLPALLSEPPQLADAINYPCLPTGGPNDILYNLNNGPGIQGFMLLVSEHPLPSWSEWISVRGQPIWSRDPDPAGGVVVFDGVATRYEGATRDPRPARGALVLTPIDWAQAQKDLTAVRFIAFPVMPKENR